MPRKTPLFVCLLFCFILFYLVSWPDEDALFKWSDDNLGVSDWRYTKTIGVQDSNEVSDKHFYF